MDIPSVKDKVSTEEWKLRVDLAACYRLVALYGWSDLVFTHISVRIPGPEHHFLINPYGLMFDESPPAAWSRSTSNATSCSIRRFRSIPLVSTSIAASTTAAPTWAVCCTPTPARAWP